LEKSLIFNLQAEVRCSTWNHKTEQGGPLNCQTGRPGHSINSVKSIIKNFDYGEVLTNFLLKN
jgi:hypothetical protein